MVTFGLDLQQAGNLHRRTQENGVQHLLSSVLGKLPSFGQSAHQSGEAKHLVEISLEPVPDQTGRSFFSWRNRFRLSLQMAAAAASKRRRISIFWRTLSTSSAGMLRALGLPLISTEICIPFSRSLVGFPHRTYRGIAPNKTEHSVRLVTARNVKRGYFEIEPQEFIPAEEYSSWMSRGMPRPGDVLFTTEGHTLRSAAKLPTFDKVALAQRLRA
jgi:hypothetical protein